MDDLVKKIKLIIPKYFIKTLLLSVQHHGDELNNVSNVDFSVSVQVGSFHNDISTVVQIVIDEQGDVSNVHEAVTVHIARNELGRPGVLVADLDVVDEAILRRATR